MDQQQKQREAIMSLEGKTYLISPQKWPGWYIYMVKNSPGNVRGWSCDPGPQGHWTLEKIGLNLYRAAPKEWPNWYMYMQNGADGNVRGWNGDPGHQGHWYVEQKGTVIIEEQHIPTYTFRPKAYPAWFMYMQKNGDGNVRGLNRDPGTQGYFIFTAI